MRLQVAVVTAVAVMWPWGGTGQAGGEGWQDEGDLWLERAQVQQVQQVPGRLQEAQEASRTLLEREAEGAPGRVGAAPEVGLEHLRRAVRRVPADAAAWCELGFALGTEGRLEEAKEAWARALSLDGARVASWYGLAGVEALAQRPAAALQAYGEVLRRDPDHVGALYGQAMVLASQRRWDLAIDGLELAMRQDPACVTCQLALVGLYERVGDGDGARRAREDLSRLDPLGGLAIR